MKKKAKKKVTQVQAQIRMPPALLDRIRLYQARFNSETGAQIGFSAAARVLIEKGLDAT